MVIELLSFFWRSIKGVHFLEIVVKAGEGSVNILKRLLVVAILLLLDYLSIIDLTLVHRKCVVGSALIDREVGGVATYFLDCLNT